MKAWKDACMSTRPSKVVIPGGTYVVDSMKFQGPCMAPIHVQVEGRLQAPINIQKMRSDDSWIVFQYINGLTLSGSGTFDGRGSLAWKQNECASSGKCSSLPIVSHLPFKQGFHFSFRLCLNLVFSISTYVR